MFLKGEYPWGLLLRAPLLLALFLLGSFLLAVGAQRAALWADIG